MPEPTSAIAIVGEVVSWVVLPLGLIVLFGGVARRSWSRSYRSTRAVIVAVSGAESTVRWFGSDGDVHELAVVGLLPLPSEGDARTVWVHPARPSDARFDSPTHDGRALIVTGALLTLVGVVGLVLSTVLPLLG